MRKKISKHAQIAFTNVFPTGAFNGVATRNFTFTNERPLATSEQNRATQRQTPIVAQDFRYFGRRGTDKWKTGAPKLCELVESLGQGHRVNFTPDLRSELVELKNRVWRDDPDKRILGKPLHEPDAQIDHESDDIVKVCQKSCYYIFEIEASWLGALSRELSCCLARCVAALQTPRSPP